jgi:hypothetical protein
VAADPNFANVPEGFTVVTGAGLFQLPGYAAGWESLPDLNTMTMAGTTPVWTSTDPYVADLANAIEAAYPGLIVGVNIQLNNPPIKGSEIDILLLNAAIQVKGGGGAGATAQVVGTMQVTGLPTILYGPALGPAVQTSVNNVGGIASTDFNAVVQVVRP